MGITERLLLIHNDMAISISSAQFVMTLQG
jgi:hypothetical protein